MKKKNTGLMLAVAMVVSVFAVAVNVSANLDGGENMALVFSDDFNDNYIDPENWDVYAYPEGTRVEEINQRLEIDIKHISGEYGGGGVWLLQNFTGEGIFEVDLQNGFSWNYLYKYLNLRDEEHKYEVRLRFCDWGPIQIIMRTPEHPDWEYTTLYPGYDTRWWNWLFHLKLIRNSDGTFTGIVTDEHGHHFEGTTSLTFSLDVPLELSLNAHKWYRGYPVMVFYDNFKVFGIPVEAVVDIDPDTLNLITFVDKWVTCYIELPEGCDVNDIDVATVMLNDTIPAELHPVAIEDYDSDGTPDLMVKFDRAEVIFYVMSNTDMEERFMTTTLTITGQLHDGTPFQGSDTIKIIT